MFTDAVTVAVETREAHPAARSDFQRGAGGDSQYSVYQDLAAPDRIFEQGLLPLVNLHLTGQQSAAKAAQQDDQDQEQASAAIIGSPPCPCRPSQRTFSVLSVTATQS